MESGHAPAKPQGLAKTNGQSAKAARLRRGWREKIEPGLYRNHRVGCRATFSRQPGIRCTCPFQAHLPTDIPGRTYPQNLEATNLRDAREEKARRQREGRRQPRRKGQATVSEFFFDSFLVKQQLRPATRRNYARIFRTYHEPLIGSVELDRFSAEHVAELIQNLEAAAAARRQVTAKRNSAWVAQQLIPLQSALSTAVRWRRIKENPLAKPALPDCPPKRAGEIDTREDPKAILSTKQVLLLCRSAAGQTATPLGHRDQMLFEVTYYFALRNSEARGLKWSDIDFDGQRISVLRQIDPVTGQEAQTKGKKARRPPGPSMVFANLRRWFDQSLLAGADPNGYLFHGQDPTAPMPISLPNRRIASVQRQAGLVDADGNPLIVFHGLRHSRASHLLLDGVPMLEVSRFLGHASQLVTANAYSHLVPDDEFAAIRDLFAEPSTDLG